VPSPFVIGDLHGFTPQVARLVGMMSYARQTTIDTVAGLSVAQLDHLHDEKSNSIGALLAHVAAVEKAYQAITFHLRDEQSDYWRAATDLGDEARRMIRGRPLDAYIADFARVRSTTLAELAKRNDKWLYEETPFWRGQPANNYFKWFHVVEDELNHRGQMRFLVKRLPAI
jgi:uncharacterized damage-inducible protein DinB